MSVKFISCSLFYFLLQLFKRFDIQIAKFGWMRIYQNRVQMCRIKKFWSTSTVSMISALFRCCVCAVLPFQRTSKKPSFCPRLNCNTKNNWRANVSWVDNGYRECKQKSLTSQMKNDDTDSCVSPLYIPIVDYLVIHPRMSRSSCV